jgi:hypothetical protein
MLLPGILPRPVLASLVPNAIHSWLNIDFVGGLKKRRREFSARREIPGKNCRPRGNFCRVTRQFFPLCIKKERRFRAALSICPFYAF